MLYVNFSRSLSGGGKKYLLQFIKHNRKKETTLILHPEHRDLVRKFNGRCVYAPESLFLSILWQTFVLPLMVKRDDVLLNADATCFYLGRRSVVMSRDMLSFEPGIIGSYRMSSRKLRLLFIKYIQLRSLKNATVSVFLTNYARNIILKGCSIRGTSVIIPHGIDIGFWKLNKKVTEINSFIYVSNGASYKNHLELLKAFVDYKEKYSSAKLYLIGAANGEESGRIKRFINQNLLTNVTITGLLDSSEILFYYRKADCILFSSGCENMPNTLLEGMATGLPVLSSYSGPMQEILGLKGLFYDPKNVQSIVDAMELISSYSNEQILEYVNYLQKTVKKYKWENSIGSIIKVCNQL